MDRPVEPIVGASVSAAGQPPDGARLMRLERDLAVRLGSARDLATALELVLDAAIDAGGCDSGGIYLLDAAGGGLSLAHHRGLGPAFVESARHVTADEWRMALILAGTPVFTCYGAGDVPDAGDAAREGLRALGVIPVRSGGEVVAALNVASHTLDEIPSAAQDALVSIASRIGGPLARVRSEESVGRMQRNLSALFDSLDDLLFILDAKGRIVECNAVVMNRLGYTREELLGQPVLQCHPPDRRDAAARTVAAMILGEARACHEPLLTKAGEQVPVETFVTPGTWDGKPALIGVTRDLTARREAEDARAEAEAQLQVVFQAATIGMALVNPQGRFDDVNPALAAIFGYTVEEMRGVDFAQLTHPEDLMGSVERFRRIARGITTQERFEKRYIHRDGSTLWAEVVVHRVARRREEEPLIFSLVRDITEAKRADLARQESEERFRVMANAAPVMIWLCDSDGQCTFLNQQWLAFSGRTMSQELGTGWLDRVHPDDFAHCTSSFREALAARSAYRTEYRLRRHDGTYRWILDSGAPRLRPGGEFAGYVGSAIDIHDRRDAEEQRERTLADLTRALEQVKQLSGMIPICAACKKVRDDKGFWAQVEVYIRDHSEAEFSHGICPDCMRRLYPGY